VSDGASADFCHTEEEPTPWLAIDYGTAVTVQRVEIFNRRQCCGDRTRNVDVRISDVLPTSGSQMFSGGTLLGSFAGPGTDGKMIPISGQAASGRFVIVQMNNGNDVPLNLKEVKAFGGSGPPPPLPSGPGVELKPVGATLSSTLQNNNNFGAAKCIDGNTEGPDEGVSDGASADFCHTEEEPTPWLAIDYGTAVTVQRVEIFNRRQCCGDRTRNVDVRISDVLPTSGSQMFSGGTLLGSFAGPGTDGKMIPISGQAASGRFVIVQMNNGNDVPLNLKEVKAFSG